MSSGSFDWSNFNVLHQFSRLLDRESLEYEIPFPEVREYILGIPEGLDGQYKVGASLIVNEQSTAILANLNLDIDFGQHLHRNIRRATARRPDGSWVYHFSREDPRANINCIYDMKPLTGLWPWPRDRTNSLEDGNDDVDSDTDRKIAIS